jgi:flagellar biosynthesis protein FlhB
VRGAWGIAKAFLLVLVAAWAIRSEWTILESLGRRGHLDFATTSAAAIRRLAFALGIATLALGLLDYFMARRRVEAALQTTPEESREEAKSIDGDPAVRARRLRLAKSWRADPGEILNGAVIVLSGPGGLAVVLGGNGPLGKVVVKGSARGASGAMLKKSANRAGLTVVDSPELARHFATASARTQVLNAVLRQELAEIWPACDTETTARTSS